MKPLLKKTILLFAFFSSTIIIAGNTEGYDIKITIKNLKEGGKCFLADYYHGSQYKQDSAISNNKGELFFKGTKKYNQGVYLIVTPDKKYFDFIMDAEQHFTIETDTSNYVKNMKVKGSEENKSFFDYQNFMFDKQKQIEPLRDQYKTYKDNKDSAKAIQDRMNVIDKAVKDYKHNFIKNSPSTFVGKLLKLMEEPVIPDAPTLPNGKKDSTFAYKYYKAHYFDNFDFSDERLLRTPIFDTKIKQYLEKTTVQHPDSIAVSAFYIIEKGRANPEVFKYLINWLVYLYESSNIMGMDAVFVQLVEKYYVTNQVTWIDSTQNYNVTNKAFRLKPILLGKQAVPIELPDSLGKYIPLYNIKSKYTVLVFWEPGCGHCKKEIPKLFELYKTKLKARGVEVYAVNSESKADEWKKFIIEHKLDWINVHEPDDYKRAVAKSYYYIQTTPSLFLLDENKIIRAKRIDADKIEDVINFLEKQKK